MPYYKDINICVEDLEKATPFLSKFGINSKFDNPHLRIPCPSTKDGCDKSKVPNSSGINALLNCAHHILLIHIPKTGGSSLEKYLQKKSHQTLFSGPVNDIMPNENLRKISLQHQTLHHIWKYRKILNVDFNNLTILTIVRNPYDRIVSDLFHFNFITKETPTNKIYEIIKKYIMIRDLDNHNIPQYKFICDAKGNINTYIKKIKIFKTETLTKELHAYGFTDYKGKDSSNHYMQYLNEDSIKLINKVYQIDFLLFDYMMV